MNWDVFWAILFGMFIFVPLMLVWFFAIIDLFMRPDLRGISKVVWLLAILFFPVLGTVVYFITKPTFAMPRDPKPEEVAATLTQLKSLHEAGVLNDEQYTAHRSRLLMAA